MAGQSVQTESAVWNFDPAHTVVEFSVKHMMFATVKGTFGQFEGKLVGDPEDLTGASVEFTVETGSIDTKEADRDKHLLSADFFDAENHPKITFKGDRFTKTGEDTYDLEGELTIRGVTKPVTAQVVYEGRGKDPWGNERIGLTGKARINRKDFGLTWNAALETGGFLVGDAVDIALHIEAVRA